MWKRLKQFSLRSVLGLMLLVCATGAMLANYAKGYYQEQEALKVLSVTPQNISIRKSNLATIYKKNRITLFK